MTIDSTPLGAALAGNSHCAKRSFRFEDAKTGMPRQENGKMPSSVFTIPRVQGLVLHSSSQTKRNDRKTLLLSCYRGMKAKGLVKEMPL